MSAKIVLVVICVLSLSGCWVGFGETAEEQESSKKIIIECTDCENINIVKEEGEASSAESKNLDAGKGQ